MSSTTEQTTTEAPEETQDLMGTKEPEAPEAPETEAPEDAETSEEHEGEDTFPRSYVERLRQESAAYRTKAAKAEALSDALWESRLKALGALADPTDLPRPEDADPLDDEAVGAAVKDLLERKPHLASRVPRGNVGQGYVAPSEPVSLLGMLRSNAS